MRQMQAAWGADVVVVIYRLHRLAGVGRTGGRLWRFLSAESTSQMHQMQAAWGAVVVVVICGSHCPEADGSGGAFGARGGGDLRIAPDEGRLGGGGGGCDLRIAPAICGRIGWALWQL